MSASAPTIHETLQARGAETSDLRESVREVELTRAFRVAWHPWMDLPNFGSDTFRFNVPYASLPRLTAMPLWTVLRPVIHAKSKGSTSMLGVSNYTGTGEVNPEMVMGFGDSSGMGGSVPSGSGAPVTRVQQRPEELMRDLLQAWGTVGMTELRSLAASDEQELMHALALHEAVMGAALDYAEQEAGRRPPGLVLQHFPDWLARGAPRALEYALSRGVATLEGGEVVRRRLRPEDERRGLALITEVQGGIDRAFLYAVDPANGKLPQTRRMLQAARHSSGEGKTHFDAQDLWMMEQFPDFPMDTEVDRAQRALGAVVREGQNAQDGLGTGIMAVIQQNTDILSEMRAAREQSERDAARRDEQMQKMIQAMLGQKGNQ